MGRPPAVIDVGPGSRANSLVRRKGRRRRLKNAFFCCRSKASFRRAGRNIDDGTSIALFHVFDLWDFGQENKMVTHSTSGWRSDKRADRFHVVSMEALDDGSLLQIQARH